MLRALKIRRAAARDADALIAFNRAMAFETERKDLWPRVIGAGVRALLRRACASLRRSQPRFLDAARRREQDAEFRASVAIRPDLEARVEADRRRGTIGAAHRRLGFTRKKPIVRGIGRRFPARRVHVLELD